jgi:hypothetical protein
MEPSSLTEERERLQKRLRKLEAEVRRLSARPGSRGGGADPLLQARTSEVRYCRERLEEIERELEGGTEEPAGE